MMYMLQCPVLSETAVARPKYETGEDLERERIVAARVGEFLSRDFTKLAMTAGADFLYTGPGKPDVVVEIKTRTNAREDYGTYMVSRNKYGGLLDWSRRGYRAALFVHWTDSIGYVMVPAPVVDFGLGGRSDRNDSLDRGTMAYIPTGSFKVIGPSVL